MEILHLACCQSPEQGGGNTADFTLGLKASAWKLQVTYAHVSLDKGSHVAE